MNSSTNQTENLEPISPQEMVLQMVMGLAVAQCIFAAAKLGIADRLKEGPKHCDDLATATHTHCEALYRLLQALASRGIFSETQPKYFQLTPLATCLQENQPGSLRNFILLQGEVEYAGWENIMHTLYTGENAFENVHGIPFFQYLKQNPRAGEIFAKGMTEMSAIHKTAIVSAYDFSSITKVADISGGQGILLATILKQYPTMKGVLFEQSEVIEKAKHLLKDEGVIERCELITGDFFQSIPVKAEAYLFKQVLHDWNEQEAVQILRNCRQAMTGGERLLVIEKVMASENTWRNHFGSMKMLVLLGGQVRTKEDFRKLFEAAGFKLTQIIPTQSAFSVIEGVANGA